MIDITYCPEEKYCYIYNPDNTTLTYTNNVVVFNYIRKEIAKNKLDGYTVEYDGNKYKINNYGEINNLPSNLFFLHEDLEFERYSYTATDIFEKHDNTLIDYCTGRDIEFENVI